MEAVINTTNEGEGIKKSQLRFVDDKVWGHKRDVWV